MKTYCFDLDNTLCDSIDDDYPQSTPKVDRIRKVNKLYDEGNKIIICTARGAISRIDWAELTKEQLRLWNIKHHELWLGKPYADYYIDDKAINHFDFDWESK